MQSQSYANTTHFDRPPADDARPTIRHVVNLVARHHKVSARQIFNASRCQLPVARARQLAMYLTHVVLGESLTAVGMAFGRHRSTVTYACGLIEDMRDDAAFDAEVCALEALLEREGA